MASIATSTTAQTSTVAPPKTIPEGLIQEENNVVAVPPNARTAPADGGLKIEPLPDVARVTPLNMLGEHPAWIDCPFCHRRALTKIQKEGSSAQAVMTLLCCLICICLVCLPSAAGWFENTHHICSSCKTRVATKQHDGGPTQVYAPQVQNTVPTNYGNTMQATPAVRNEGGM